MNLYLFKFHTKPKLPIYCILSYYIKYEAMFDNYKQKVILSYMYKTITCCVCVIIAAM